MHPTSASHTNNIDPAEIARFAALAEQWWDAKGPLAALHAMNPLRLQWIEQHVDLHNKQVLDVGCGGGLLAEAMADAHAHVTGIDVAEESIHVAQLHAQQGSKTISYQCLSPEALASQQPARFDVVTCMEMLEHVPDPSAIVQACCDLLVPGGVVFFATIARNPKAFMHAIVAAEYLLKLLPRGTHSYNKFISPSELMRHCRQSGLQPFATQGVHYNPFTRQYSLNTNVDVNYIIACRKLA